MFHRRIAVLWVGLFLAAGQVFAVIPSDALLDRLQPSGKVNDFARILSEGQRATMELRLADLEQKTGAQIAVVTLESLEGGDIDDFTNKLFGRWGVGQKGKDNGVMVLVALNDRKARIEVGYGLEPIIPDGLAGRILGQDMFPMFKQGRYADGLMAGVERVAGRIEQGEPASAEDHKSPDELGALGRVGVTLFFAVFVAIGSFMCGAGAGSRVAFLILWGLGFGGIPLTMAFPIAGVGPASFLAVAGAYLLWLGFRVGRKSPKQFRTGARRSSYSSGWVWGASSGGGFSSGGGGGFGGGCSGGGGASGGW